LLLLATAEESRPIDLLPGKHRAERIIAQATADGITTDQPPRHLGAASFYDLAGSVSTHP
jgi:hypothetical protein